MTAQSYCGKVFLRISMFVDAPPSIFRRRNIIGIPVPKASDNFMQEKKKLIKKHPF